MQITINILRAYEYYIYIYKKNNDVNIKIPFQDILDFSKLKGKHEIWLYIKCAIEKTPILNAYIF
jgi:hypothetical protein